MRMNDIYLGLSASAGIAGLAARSAIAVEVAFIFFALCGQSSGICARSVEQWIDAGRGATSSGEVTTSAGTNHPGATMQ